MMASPDRTVFFLLGPSSPDSIPGAWIERLVPRGTEMICSQVLASAWDFGNAENFALVNKSQQSGEFGNSHAENSPRDHNASVSLALTRLVDERHSDVKSHSTCDLAHCNLGSEAAMSRKANS
jgi:hypothetical protein